ncbi:hypothetical protein V6N13_001279 [Hibiscus sabdariffa]|uniref:Uncharacterized protein n=1 Tax=Hibiscus sabdariffa TaxID=183260 RepID=A0ABR2G8W5_9ROSI
MNAPVPQINLTSWTSLVQALADHSIISSLVFDLERSSQVMRSLFREWVYKGGKIRIDPRKSRCREEAKLEDVIGRSEVEELPEFEDGAFEVKRKETCWG